MSPTWKTADGSVRLYLGDCEPILPTIGDVGTIVSDPPYGIDYKHSGQGPAATGRTALRRFTEAISGDDREFDPSHLLRFKCVLFGADHYCSRLPSSGTMHVWDKAYSGGPDDSFSDAELFWTSWRCARVVVRYLWKGVCQDGEKGVRKFHPSQKPIAVMERCIELAGDDAPIVDPYMGSGSTGVAAVRRGLPFVGIERERKHFDSAVGRIAEELKRLALFEPPPPIITAKQKGLFE